MHCLGAVLAAVVVAGTVCVSGFAGQAEAWAQSREVPSAKRPLPIGAVPPGTQVGSPGDSVEQRLPTSRVFAASAGLILSPVKPASVKDFEAIIRLIHEALATSSNQVRSQQAAGWKVYRAIEPGPGGSILFVFAMSPAVDGADYAIAKILLEVFPLDEVLEALELYNTALAGPQTLLNLELSEDFAQPVQPAVPFHR